MVICFECAPETKKLLDSMVESGAYKDYGEIILSAIENMSVLHKELSHKGVLVIDSKNGATLPTLKTKDEKTNKRNKASTRTQNKNSQRADLDLEAHYPHVSNHVPRFFSLDGIGEPPSSLATLPSDVWVKGQQVPLERWIFGQYNKLLPAKATCRALAHLLEEKSDGVPIEETASKISEEAFALGNFLTNLDKKYGISRDDALSTAFPSPNREREKSRLRYANQFVANASKQGRVSSVLMDLKLINHTGGKFPRLKLTEAGWRFATLWNPVFDVEDSETTQKFTVEEKSFLLEHISNSVPTEDFAYRAILTAIIEGAKTPGQLDSALQRYVSQSPGRNLSSSFLSSQRSGAVSRMVDLGLAKRIREGVKISYIVTDLGKQYAQDTVISIQGSKHLE